MKAEFIKPGWAVLVTYKDGSGGFWATANGVAPTVWNSYSRHEAVEEARKVNASEGRARVIPKGTVKARVVKVQFTWPQIIS